MMWTCILTYFTPDKGAKAQSPFPDLSLSAALCKSWPCSVSLPHNLNLV